MSFPRRIANQAALFYYVLFAFTSKKYLIIYFLSSRVAADLGQRKLFEYI